MKNFERLNKNEMKMIVGGTEQTIGGDTYCSLNCWEGGDIIEVTDCNKSTTESKCDNISNATCISGTN